MVTIEAITSGLTKYLDSEIIPQMPPAKAVLVGTIAALYLRQAANLLDKIPASMGIRNGNNVDLETVRDVVKSQIKTELPIDIPLIGRFTIDNAEIDKIYRYIVSGE